MKLEETMNGFEGWVRRVFCAVTQHFRLLGYAMKLLTQPTNTEVRA
ncbi:MAG: hypothetical protein AAB278_03555 [Pseudomonadota bacterium]